MKHHRAVSYFCLFICVGLSILIPGISSAEPLDNWHVRTSPTGSTLRSVTYGNGMFVAVGDNRTILTSNDGEVWTARTSGTTVQLNGVTWADGIFVAVGLGETILTSLDGVNWTTRRTGTIYGLNAVTYGNGTFVAVGSPEIILTSLDGINWTVRKSDVIHELNAVTYGNGMFLILRDQVSIYSSNDGIHWSSEGITGYGGFYFFNIAYGQGSFILVGGWLDTGAVPLSVEIILSSFDGLNWRQRNFGSARDVLFGAAYGNSYFIAVGENGSILSSSGGTHWIARQSVTTQWLYGATYGNGTFVVVGDKGTILQSAPLTANTDCTAILSSDLSLHVPIIDFGGSYLWADFQYEARGTSDVMMKVTNADFVTDPTIFSSCQPSTLTYNTTYKLHIPSLNFENLFYRADLEYVPTDDGQIWFKLTNTARN